MVRILAKGADILVRIFQWSNVSDEEVVLVKNHIQGIGHLVNQRNVSEVSETSWPVISWMECEDVQAKMMIHFEMESLG